MALSYCTLRIVVFLNCTSTVPLLYLHSTSTTTVVLHCTCTVPLAFTAMCTVCTVCTVCKLCTVPCVQAAPEGVAFSAMASSGQCAYMVGGKVRRPGVKDRDRCSVQYILCSVKCADLGVRCAGYSVRCTVCCV